MDTQTLGRCLYCHRPLLTSFVFLPAVKGTGYVAPAHVRCAELAFSGATGETLDAERAAIAQTLAGVEALFLGHSEEVTP